MAKVIRTSLRTTEGRIIAAFMVLAISIGLSLAASAGATITHSESSNMNLTSTTVTLNWTTSEPTNTCIKMDMGNVNPTSWECYSSTLTTSHAFPISSLLPGTTYSYVVGYTSPSPELYSGTIFHITTPSSGGGGESSSWLSRTWQFADGTYNSYILNRTDSTYLNYIASVQAQCSTLTIAQWNHQWYPNAGNDQDWEEFGIPNCTGTSSPTPTPYYSPTPTPTIDPNIPSVQTWGMSLQSDGNSVIGISFNKEMNQSTFSDANVYMYKANDATRTHIPLTIQKEQYRMNLWTLTRLDTGVEYVTVATIGVKSLAGYALASEYSCRFGAITSGYLTACPTGTAQPSPTPMPTISPTPMPSPSYNLTKTILVKVTREDGSGITDAMVGSWSNSGGYPATNLGGGQYKMLVSGGTWNVMVQPTDPPRATWGYFEGPQVVSFKPDTTAESRSLTFNVKAGSATVKGMVLRPDGTPLPQGSGIGIKEARYGTYLNADGSFLVMLPPGTYTFTVFPADPAYTEMQLPSQTLESGKTLDLGKIILTQPTNRITGRVTNKDGAGLANIPVHAFQSTGNGAFARAITGSDGRYTVFVDAGSWMVRAEPYPESNYSNPNPPMNVTVMAGTAAIADFVLIFADTTVSGVVVDASGAPLGDFYGFVSAGDPYSSQRFGGAVEKGKFTFRVQAGTYPVQLFTAPGSDYTPPAPQTVTVKPGASVSLTFKVARYAANITGYVKDDAGMTLKNLSLHIAATSGFGSGAGAVWQPGVYDPATGAFRIEVSPGTWYLAVDLQGASGYAQPKPADLVVTVPQGGAATKDITLKRAGSVIQGTVRKADGTPFAGVFVAVDAPYGGTAQTPDANHPAGFGTQADGGGFYRISVPAGSYVVRAFAPPAAGGLNPQSVDVTVGSADTKTVDLRFRAAQAVITGTVDGVTGKTFVYAWSDQGGYAQTETDERGNYSLSVTKDEVWRVAVSGEANKTQYRSAETAVSVTQERVEAKVTALATRKLPDAVSTVGSAGNVNIVGVKDGASITIPPNAIEAQGNVTITVTPDTRVASQSQERVVGIGYGIEIRGSDARKITQFNGDAVISFPYTEADIAAIGAKAAALKLVYWDESADTWKNIDSMVIDVAQRVITGSVNHLTRFALVAPADTLPPDPPYGVSVASVSAGFKITWSNPAFDFHHAKVYRSTEKGLLGSVIKNNLTENSYTDAITLQADTTYYYVVRTVDLAGNESTNTTQYSVNGPAQTPTAKELAPQTIASSPDASGSEPSAIPYNPQIPAYQKYPNGTLLRATGDQKVWVIMNGFKRYIVGPQVLGFYPHLKNAPIVDVPAEELDQYGLAAWVRYVNNPKVYEVNDDATKHWLDMSAEDFYDTGRRWEAVFVINKPEVDFYKTGVNVTIIK